MLPTVYNGRDNEIVWRLEAGGRPVESDAVTAVVMHIEPAAGGQAVCLDTREDSELELADGGRVKARLGHLALSPGGYRVSLTVFDTRHSGGIAWDTDVIRVEDWPDC